MPQSLAKIPVHIVFSTKNRERMLDEQIQPHMHAVLASVCLEYECTPIAVGGTEDHVHILCILSKKIAAMKLVEKVKVRSSIWIKEQHRRYGCFHWQSGYAMYAVAPRDIPIAAEYIARQKEHHKERGFQDEQRILLKRAQIEWDEKYCWD